MDNVVDFPSKKSDTPPYYDYVVTTTENEVFFATGFMVFTNSHVVIMQEMGPEKHTVPVFLIPLDAVKIVELEDEDSAEYVD